MRKYSLISSMGFESRWESEVALLFTSCMTLCNVSSSLLALVSLFELGCCSLFEQGEVVGFEER